QTREEQIADLHEQYFPKASSHPILEKRRESNNEGFLLACQKIPIVPDDDLLLFIAEHNPHLHEWQKNIMRIVHEEAQYFIPQIETKIMNEGWASYWHKKILDSLDLPQELYLEFLVRHNQVVRPHHGGLNPYHLGFKIWEDICRRYNDPTPEEAEELGASHPTGIEMLFQTRETDRDVSFLRRHLTENLMRELDMFAYAPKEDNLVVEAVSDKDNWKQVKATLIAGIGMNLVPVIKIYDADAEGNRTLLLAHEHEGRDLELSFAKKTLQHIYTLWGRNVMLKTIMSSKKVLLRYDTNDTKVTIDKL
ncbi:MAG: SpoVR family protein, partial [Patescibacteria group bacterium]